MTDIERAYIIRPKFQPQKCRVSPSFDFRFPDMSKMVTEGPARIPFQTEVASKDLAQYGPEGFRLDYQFHTFWPTLIQVQLHRDAGRDRTERRYTADLR